ncbi:MAG: hypothetical protein AB1422_07025 [bacterium]
MARFASACGSIITLPVWYSQSGEKKSLGAPRYLCPSKLPKEPIVCPIV